MKEQGSVQNLAEEAMRLGMHEDNNDESRHGDAVHGRALTPVCQQFASRAEFDEAWVAFWRSQGKVAPKNPRFRGQEIDTYTYYTKVQARGGYDAMMCPEKQKKFNKKKGESGPWTDLLKKDLGLTWDPKKCTNPASLARSEYEKRVLAFDDHLAGKKRDQQRGAPATGSGSRKRKRKAEKAGLSAPAAPAATTPAVAAGGSAAPSCLRGGRPSSSVKKAVKFPEGEKIAVAFGSADPAVDRTRIKPLLFMCDKCKKLICTSRYSCSGCKDFDLCEACFNEHREGDPEGPTHIHPAEGFIRVASDEEEEKAQGNVDPNNPAPTAGALRAVPGVDHGGPPPFHLPQPAIPTPQGHADPRRKLISSFAATASTDKAMQAEAVDGIDSTAAPAADAADVAAAASMDASVQAEAVDGIDSAATAAVSAATASTDPPAAAASAAKRTERTRDQQRGASASGSGGGSGSGSRKRKRNAKKARLSAPAAPAAATSGPASAGAGAGAEAAREQSAPPQKRIKPSTPVRVDKARSADSGGSNDENNGDAANNDDDTGNNNGGVEVILTGPVGPVDFMAVSQTLSAYGPLQALTFFAQGESVGRAVFKDRESAMKLWRASLASRVGGPPIKVGAGVVTVQHPPDAWDILNNSPELLARFARSHFERLMNEPQ